MSGRYVSSIRTGQKYTWGIYLDPTRGDPHYDPTCTEITLMISSDATGELGEIIKCLEAGQYQIEGGYPCVGGTCRHPARSVWMIYPELKIRWARFPGGEDRYGSTVPSWTNFCATDSRQSQPSPRYGPRTSGS